MAAKAMDSRAMDSRVLVTRPVSEAALDRLRRSVRSLTVLAEDEARDRARLLAAVRDCHGAFTLLTERVDEELLAAAPNLRIVANMAVGYDNVDVEAATRRGVLVTNTPGVLTETTADLALALLLGAARRVAEGDRYLRAGRFDRWGPLMLLGREVTGRVLGIAGMGRIGTAVAERAHLGFGMEVIYWNRSERPQVDERLGARRVDKQELLRRSDFLSLHLPLEEETRHFLDADALARMKPTAVLVNTSRGPLVDEAALAQALTSGTIWSAGLDVFEEEPKVHPALLELENLVLLPHLGSASEETRSKMADLAVDNLLAALAGDRPPALVNPELWPER